MTRLPVHLGQQPHAGGAGGADTIIGERPHTAPIVGAV